MDNYGDYQLDRMYYMTETLEQKMELDEWLFRLEETMNEQRFNFDPKMFEEEIKMLDQSGDGTYYFLDQGKNKVRLLLSPEREISVFAQLVIRSFKGKERQQYMLPVLVGDSKGIYNNNVRYMVVPKTVYKAILELLANKWDLFHPETGHGIVIDRTGEGLKTRYSVTPSPNPIPVDYLTLQFQTPLEEVAAQLEASDREEDEEILHDDDIPF